MQDTEVGTRALPNVLVGGDSPSASGNMKCNLVACHRGQRGHPPVTQCS